MNLQNSESIAIVQIAPFKPPARIERVLDSLAADLPAENAFEVEIGGERRRIGTGPVKFRLTVNNAQGVSALGSLDEKRIGEAYLDGDISLEGDLVAALDLRTSLTDAHPLAYLWSTYGQRLLFGQVNRDRQWIHEHYDAESDFYLLFLDPEHRCYSHGYFESDDEPLARAGHRRGLGRLH